MFGSINIFYTFAARSRGKSTYRAYDSVAQLVEQYTFNVWVLGSNPSGITKKASLKSEAFFVSDGVRTPGSERRRPFSGRCMGKERC